MRPPLMVLFLLTQSCATFFTPKATTVFVDSARGKVSGTIRCNAGADYPFEAPSIVTIPSNEDCVILYPGKDGKKSIPVQRIFNPAMLGNAGSPAYIFLPVDFWKGYNSLPTSEAIVIPDE